MKNSRFKLLFTALVVGLIPTLLLAQDDDGIYGDIYTAPQVNEEEILDTASSPLDGYSTVDDYYPEGGYDQNGNSNQPYSEQYVDENGNTIINNNYYGDYYEDDDFTYSARIRRFHRNNWSWGYYDPWYTNMYYYTYDPYYWGTSIYVGYWPSYRWYWNNNLTWAWGWGYQFGWGSPYYSPACYGWGYNGWGYNSWGWNSPYWNGYNNGYWNGYYDGMAYGGYYNTYDRYSGIYYGHRGSSVASGGSSIGSGYRSKSFAEAYNQAAMEGKVHHANVGNVLGLDQAREVKGNLDGFTSRSLDSKTSVNPTEGVRSNSTTSSSSRGNESVLRGNESKAGETRGASSVGANTARSNISNEVRTNVYQRSNADRNTSAIRNVPSNVDRSRAATMPNSRPNTASRSNTYQRGNEATRYYNRTDQNVDRNRGNVYQDMQRTRPSTDYYQRNNSNSNQYSTPSRNQNNTQYSRPSNQQSVPSRNYQSPSRNNSTPSRTQPSRTITPQKSSPSRSTTPNRGSSGGSYSSPSRSSGSFGGSSPSRSGSSSPSRGSGSRSGRP